jgi:formiminoglutamase
MKHHINSSSTNWLGRHSDSQLYWHELVQLVADMQIKEGQDPKVALLGYAVEAGVIRNGGRSGAKDGPDSIRNMLGPLANHLNDAVSVYDYGNIVVEDDDLDAAQLLMRDTIYACLQENHLPVILGGGHDAAYPHYLGIQKYLETTGQTVGIINFDAHFDLRPLIDGKGHSGSPFFQIANQFSNSFNYLVLGIQKASNPKTLFETASSLHCNFLEIEQFNIAHWDQVKNSITDFIGSVDKVYVSIDLDGFSSAYAPGVSAPSPLGFTPEIVWKALDVIIQSNKLLSVDIVELNPTFDPDNATARLGARCLEHIVSAQSFL